MEKLIQQLKEDTLQSDYAQKKLVFGEGKQNAKICMVGEAPGGDEEKQGRPFVGKAGKNLSSFLEAVGLKREEIYITNVVKFRPTNISPKTGKFVNRPPKKNRNCIFFALFNERIGIGTAGNNCHIRKCSFKSHYRTRKCKHRRYAWGNYKNKRGLSVISIVSSGSHYL